MSWCPDWYHRRPKAACSPHHCSHGHLFEYCVQCIIEIGCLYLVKEWDHEMFDKYWISSFWSSRTVLTICIPLRRPNSARQENLRIWTLLKETVKRLNPPQQIWNFAPPRCNHKECWSLFSKWSDLSLSELLSSQPNSSSVSVSSVVHYKQVATSADS